MIKYWMHIRDMNVSRSTNSSPATIINPVTSIRVFFEIWAGCDKDDIQEIYDTYCFVVFDENGHFIDAYRADTLPTDAVEYKGTNKNRTTFVDPTFGVLS